MCALSLFSVVNSAALRLGDKRTVHYELRRPHQAPAPAARGWRRLLLLVFDSEAPQTLVHKDDAATLDFELGLGLEPATVAAPTNSVGACTGRRRGQGLGGRGGRGEVAPFLRPRGLPNGVPLRPFAPSLP